MISFNFNLSNPWSDRWQHVRSFSCETPFKNKFLEMEIYKDSTILSFMFRLATRTSHSGLSLELGILGYSFSLDFYDSRHWNKDEGRYYIYDESGKAR